MSSRFVAIDEGPDIIAHFRYRLEGEEDSEQASDPAIREQDSTPDSSRLSNWIHSPKWGFVPMHKG